MMRKEMRPKERVIAALNLEKPDQVPVGAFATHVAGRIAGISIKDYATNGKKMAISQLALYEKANFDILFPFSHVGMIAEGWGSRIRYAEGANVAPMIEEYAVKKPEDWEKLKPFEIEDVQGIQVLIEAIRDLKKWVGEEVFILGVMFSPMTSATHVCSLKDVMIQVRKNPELLSIGLDVITKSLIKEAKALTEAGADGIFLAVTRATGEILTQKQYENIAKQYDERLLREIKLPVIVHICGIKPFLEMAAVLPNVRGINWWDKGSNRNLHEVKKKVGHHVCLLGGIDQTKSILMGSSEDVEEEAKEAIKQGAKGGGFILFSGCDLPIETPLENIKAISISARKWGRYPIEFNLKEGRQ